MSLQEFYKQIEEDSKQSIMHLLSEPGHGKTSSLRSIIAHIIHHNPFAVFKVFDVSQAWYHNAPIKYRQLVTRYTRNVENLDNCVYEMGSMSKPERRAFVGEIMRQDYDERYRAGLEGRLDEYPLLLYVIEEADTIFGSYSFRASDEYSQVFQLFSSVGRNYKMRGFLISTAEQGEIAPPLRRRTRKIYGRVIGKQDIASARKTGAQIDVTQTPKYHFTYLTQTQRIPDTGKHTPQTYVKPERHQHNMKYTTPEEAHRQFTPPRNKSTNTLGQFLFSMFSTIAILWLLFTSL